MDIREEFKEAMKITEGVRPLNDSEFVIDMRDDYESDIINLAISDDLYFSNFRDNIYYFGYSFKDSASRKDRSNFVNWLKSQAKITNQFREFVSRPLIRLEREGIIDDIKLVVYPDDRENRLVRLIIESLYSVVKGASLESVVAVKNAPSETESGNVLIVDDINTSGSTLNEVINQIHKINKDCKIYIFTLIGK